MKFDPLGYEMPWRPNYEAYSALGWGAASCVAMGVNTITQMPHGPFYWMTGMCAAMALTRLPKAMKLKKLQQHLTGRPLAFMSLKELQKNTASRQEDLWLGYGFEWENRHIQRAFEILKRDTSSIRPSKKKSDTQQIGQPWIHGIEPNEEKLYQPIKHAEGHILILGTTGSGKTRCFDTLITQAILRDEAVFIIDPKGDKELRDNARRACEAMGKPDRFVNFHPAFPEESIRIDMMANFTRATELASRVAALIPSETGNDPFTSFGWLALNNLINGLLIIDNQPNLVTLRRYLEGGAEGLVAKAIEVYAKRVVKDYDAKVAPYLAKVKATSPKAIIAKQMMMFYYEVVQPEKSNSDLEGLLSMFKHDIAHFGKMIATLMPVMSMLTSGELANLLSPDPNDKTDSRPIMDTTMIINQAKVAYIGLDSLTDGMVGSAIGSLLLSDMTAVAGDRYNFGVDNRPVNVFADEAAEVINDPFIRLLNKGRGALLRLVVATQTIADFSARMGSKDKALQVLGNINNLICLRVLDNETQKYFAEGLPTTRVKYVMRTQGQNTDGNEPILHGGNQGERLMEEEMELVPPALLGMLPNLEFFAKISGGRVIKGRLPILVG